MPIHAGKFVILGAALAALALGGCAETKLVAHTVKQVQGPPGQGQYKVGDPYQINGTWYYPAEDYSYAETGIASFYGGESKGTNFHGRYTANGEIYDMNSLTAAHQTLPMPSLVRVTNLENGRSLVLRVNDRGPFVRGRIIDVSRRSAQLLGFDGQGTARVRVEMLADESRTLKIAMLNGTGTPPAGTEVAAIPRETVASDALPPPPGARQTTAPAASSALPPPSATLPPAQPGQPRVDSKGRVRPAQQEPMARPAPPVMAPPSTSNIASAAPVVSQPAPAPTRAPVTREAAALPVPQQANAQPVVTQQTVRPTTLFVQAGAFSNYDTAYRLGARLSRYGKIQVTPTAVGAQQVYRVRVGPVFSVNEADDLLEQVASVVPEARVVVVD